MVIFLFMTILITLDMLKAISQASVKANVSAANIGRATPFNCVDLHAIGTKFFSSSQVNAQGSQTFYQSYFSYIIYRIL